MKTERELFQEWFKTIWLGIDLIQTIGEDYAFKLSGESYGEDVVNNHWQTWQAATQREGFKFVPVEPTLKMSVAKFKNMKIAINAEQPLDEVVAELERLGYAYSGGLLKHICILATDHGRFLLSDINSNLFCGVLFEETTLTELKGMK